MMWKCPDCKVHMEMVTDHCTKCNRQLQYFENVKGVSLEEMLVMVTLEDIEAFNNE